MYSLVLFFIGLFVGSFLNVVVDRLLTKESIIYPPSHCDHCKKKIVWYDLIPVVSFAFLRGQCRHCHAKLSFYYPITEIVTGVLFAAAFIFFGGNITAFVFSLFIIALLIILFFTDLKYGLLPFFVMLPLTLLTVLMLGILSPQQLPNHVLSGLGAFGFFFILFAATKGRGMGLGDVIYAFFMGLFLGYPKIILGLYLAFLTGALVSLILIISKKKKLSGGTVPFGPFLIVGTVVSWIGGSILIQYIQQFLLSL